MADQEALRRLTELRLRAVKEKMQQQAPQPPVHLPPMGLPYMPAQQPFSPYFQPPPPPQPFFLPPIIPPVAMQNPVLESKRKHLTELENANRRLRDQLMASQAAPREDALLRAVEKMTEATQMQQKKETDSKLEALMAQSLQMQNLLMYQMQNQPPMGMMMQQPMPAQEQPAMPGPPDDSPQHADPRWPPQQQQQQQQAPRGAADAEDAMLQKMSDINEKLSRADEEARAAAQQAVNAANERDERVRQEQKRQAEANGNGGEGGEEEEEEEEEAVIEEGDEMLQEELDAYRDVAASWLKKAVKLVVLNLLLERKTPLEVLPPFPGTVFKRGLSDNEVNERILKLGVRCKGITRAIRDATNPRDLPEALLTFLKRMVAHRQKYPPNFLLTSERKALGVPRNSERAGSIGEEEARVLLTHFLFSKILVLDLIATPWLHGIGPQAVPGKQEVGNLRLLAGLMYRAACGAVSPTPNPEDAADREVLDAIGRLPGEEAFLFQESKELNSLLVRDIQEIIEAVLLLCFPEGKAALDPAPAPQYEENRREVLGEEGEGGVGGEGGPTPRSQGSRANKDLPSARIKTSRSHVSQQQQQQQQVASARGPPATAAGSHAGASPAKPPPLPTAGSFKRQPSGNLKPDAGGQGLQRTESLKSARSVKLDVPTDKVNTNSMAPAKPDAAEVKSSKALQRQPSRAALPAIKE